MALEFKFRKEKIITDYKFFLFKEFTNIWIGDKTRTKLNANKMLYFIYLLCDIGENNPIKDVKADKREIEAKFRAYRNKDKKFTKKDIDLLEPAIELYIDLNMTPEERLLTSFDKKATQINNVLSQIIPETVTNVENGVVSFVSNSKIIADALSKLSKIRMNREKIVSSIKNEAISQKIRGQVKLSPLVRGLLKVTLNEDEIYDDTLV